MSDRFALVHGGRIRDEHGPDIVGENAIVRKMNAMDFGHVRVLKEREDCYDEIARLKAEIEHKDGKIKAALKAYDDSLKFKLHIRMSELRSEVEG